MGNVENKTNDNRIKNIPENIDILYPTAGKIFLAYPLINSLLLL